MNSSTPGEQAFVDRHRVARLATAELLGALHVIPIVYARVADAVYFIIDDKPKHTHTGLKRLRNIEQNPRAALLIDDDDWTSLAYLLIHGRAAVVVDREQYVRVLSALRQRHPQYRAMPLPFDSHHGANRPRAMSSVAGSARAVVVESRAVPLPRSSRRRKPLSGGP